MSAQVPGKLDFVIPTLHIHLLGDFLLLVGDTPVTTLNVPRLQSLLAYLVLHRTAPQARSHLAFLLWPNSSEAQAHSNLRKLLHQLRQTLPYADHFLHADRQSLQWQLSRPDASWTLDVQDFEEALADAKLAQKAQDTPAMRQSLERVIDLYRGDLLPACYDEWILPERDRLSQRFFQASEDLISRLEEERDYDAATTVAQHLLRQDPLHEATYRQLMRFSALRDDRASALRTYHTCASVLERELGTEPSQPTRLAYEALLQMDAVAQPRTGQLTPRSGGAPLIGRTAEWGQLQSAWRQAASGHSHLVVLSGEAGIGKTRLAEELVAWVSRQGLRSASAHCYAAEGGLAYAPVATWLRADAIQAGLSTLAEMWLSEVARLVPDLLTKRAELPPPAPLSEGWQRQRFFEAMARALLEARQPLLLLLDDLQWCDSETLEWVHYLVRFEPGAPLLLVGTVRSEETPPGHPLRAFLGALQRDGLLREVVLGPLNAVETATLAEHIVGHQFDPATITKLHQETEGNPLFVVEMVRAGRLLDGRRVEEQHRREQHVGDKALPLLTSPTSLLPPTVQTVLSTRLAQLSPLARELANVAAVIGREFSFSVLARASGEDEEALVQGLDELWQRRIVREQDSDAYDFSHNKLREEAYTTLSTTRRRFLHRRVAEALEEAYKETPVGGQVNLDAVSKQIAVHYERAGLLWKAIPYYQRAAEVASRIYANAEAISAYQQAAALLESLSTGCSQQDRQWEAAARIYSQLGDLLEMTGHYQEARQAYQQGRVHVPEQASIWQADLQRRITKTWRYPPRLETLLSGYKEAERILEQAPDRADPAWQQEWVEIQLDQLLPLQLHRVSVQEMTRVIERMQPIVEQYGTPVQQAQFFLSTAVRNMARDRYIVSEETVAKFRSALPTVQQTRNISLIGFARFGLGSSLFFAGHLDEAEEQMCAAMKVGEEVGNVTLLERCLSLLPLVFRRRGQVEKVRQVIAHALKIADMPLTGMIIAHRAWLAWRDGDMDKAEEYGKAAMAEWQNQQPANPHQWAALWPLIGVALARERLSEAMPYVPMLLDPRQQLPPEELGLLLESAQQAWDAEQQAMAHACLQQAMSFAEELGYL